MKIVFILLSFFFVLLSFSPTIYEVFSQSQLSSDREFVPEHNYMFDYNFYLSRIRQGQEGRWLVSEKYTSEPHQGSLLQIFYLYIGKIGGVIGLSPPVIYHLSRVLLGIILLIIVAYYVQKLFKGIWAIIAYFLVVTAGSFPILLWINGLPRFGTYMGWWSVIDSLQRITFIPHILLGQIGLVLFVWGLGNNKSFKSLKLFIWGLVGFVVGIVFPPVLITIYMIFVVLSVIEILGGNKSFQGLVPRLVFFLFSLPALIYMQLIFKIPPWSALPLFDINHRSILPYKDYILALGPVFWIGILGLFLAIKNRESKMYPLVSWVVSIFVLFFVFERVPEQSPTRFTEMAINIPLGILAGYFFWVLWRVRQMAEGRWGKRGLVAVISGVILMGLLVMISMVGWLTDGVKGKRNSTWLVPTGVQLVYPLKNFMRGIYFLRDKTQRGSVVFSYETAGNYIPAYAGNFVYLGHANTPQEDLKKSTAMRFFRAEMGIDEARSFMINNHISYIYFGPQEREIGGINDLASRYTFLHAIYSNSKVVIYGATLKYIK